MKVCPLIFTLVVAFFPGFTFAQDARMLVLDGSGSMWADFGQRTKIEVVRSALSKSLKAASIEQPLGLISFGHRRKKTCLDVQTLVDLAPGTAKAIDRAARDLNPTGRSAISGSIQAAANALDDTAGNARILLVTDGLGRCSADLCEKANQIKAKRPNFSVDVIGLGLTATKSKKLACLTKNTGGNYFPVRNSSEFVSVMTQFLQPTDPKQAKRKRDETVGEISLVDRARTVRVEPVEPAVVIEKTPAPASANATPTKTVERLALVEPKTPVPTKETAAPIAKQIAASAVKPATAKHPASKSRIQITAVLASDAGSYDLNGMYKFFVLRGRAPEITPVVKGYGTVAKATLPSGRYLLRYSKDLVTVEHPFEVNDGIAYNHTLPLNAAVMTVGLAPGSGKAVDKRASVQILHGVLRGTGFGKITRVVPAGTIRITGKLGQSTIEKSFEAMPGTISERVYVASAARLNVGATYTNGGKPVRGRIISHQVYPLDPSASATNQPVAQSFGDGKFIVPPGDYVVRSIVGETVVDSTVSLSTDKPVNLVVNMNAGTLAITALSAQRISILSNERNRDGKRTVLSSDYGETYQAILPPGQYVVAATYGDPTDVAEQTINVVAGKRTEALISK